MPGTTDFYAMGWKVHRFQDVEVISHNGEVPGYTTDMFLVPEKDMAIAMISRRVKDNPFRREPD
jgi:hypothetical protein